MLLDVAGDLAMTDGPEAVTMDAVAARAGVSRPLVYKHFANRDVLLDELYRREARRLHRELSGKVEAADGVEAMFRALVRGALDASGDRSHLLAVMRRGTWSRAVRGEQRDRDELTTRAFSRVVVAELGVERARATPVVALLLSLVDGVLAQWRLDPTAHRAEVLEAAYMEIVRGALVALADPPDR
ncbi:TetR/AcrR family transcriptional regulator [Actinomarinicola tropica]|uniref:TetR family transcriptional regulator n=1 Tax=Actinomarinicola tropica TaxID=2789776 RepID=A0A5Q2RMZ8_9ACTN|nr:TetR/AcrR family transcriptional regulator [Actinomarinicola tropica]QGG94575.1 TetR family transcriptional regulator [Actinomarinicola tropica]